MAQTYSGGCQCGKVRYEVQMEIGEVLACNCSKTGAKLAAINVRCVDGIDLDSLKVKRVDGRSL